MTVRFDEATATWFVVDGLRVVADGALAMLRVTKVVTTRIGPHPSDFTTRSTAGWTARICCSTPTVHETSAS